VAVLNPIDLTDLALVDGHCHPVTVEPLSDVAFALWCTESAYANESTLDSQLGYAIRRWCAPILGLPAHAPVHDYLTARRDLGPDDAVRTLMSAARLSAMLVDTGLSAAGMVTVEQMSDLAGVSARQVVRLESLAESVVDSSDASGFANATSYALGDAFAGGAVAAKSIAAYRHGLDLPPQRPTESEVRTAAGAWMRERTAGHARLSDPVLLRHLLWCAVDAGHPIQLHTGFGDADAHLIRADPARLQPFCAATQNSGTPLVLLHCYPYQRGAGWLAHLYPHVYVDVGLTVGYVGARATALLGEFLELAPFAKLMYSSDAYGLAELFLVGAAQFRHSLGRVLGGFIEDGAMNVDDADAVAAAIGAANATRLYGSPLTGSAEDDQV
jgi:predicted TIM-barrel fold metal-dependent hydrolase